MRTATPSSSAKRGPHAPGDPEPPPVVAEQPASRTYTVQEGDTCGQIAADHGISVDALPRRQPPSQRGLHEPLRRCKLLNVPAPDPATSTSSSSSGSGSSSTGRIYIVIAGDTCAAIAQDYDVPLQTFMVANGLDEESCQTIQIGQEVVIPE